MIQGVRVDRLSPRVDERGRLVELFRCDESQCPEFGQVHVSTIEPGVVKGWHRHQQRTDAFVVTHGMVRLGLYDDRAGSETDSQLNEFFVGVHNPLRIVVPPGVWFGLKNVGVDEAHVVVLTDHPYDPRDPDEDRLDPEVNDIPFDWEIRLR